MIFSTQTTQILKPALLAALLGGLSMLAVGNLSGTQDPGESGSNSGDHGDNPVVGSLPIEVDPDLDLMFSGTGQCSGVAPNPILGFVGEGSIEALISDAGGVPLGRVNCGTGFSIFGLVNSGFAMIARDDGRRGKLFLEQWLPDEYIGGTITMTSNIGTFTEPITSNRVELPLKFLSNSTALVVDAWISTDVNGDVSSSPDVVSTHIVMVGESVTVTYLP
jgi:hypothetical protein